MKQAKAADVHIVDEGFLDDVGKSPASVSQLIVQHSIAAWGSNVSCHFMNIYVSDLTVYSRSMEALSNTATFECHLLLFVAIFVDFLNFLFIHYYYCYYNRLTALCPVLPR